jgi:hypothetical protein
LEFFFPEVFLLVRYFIKSVFEHLGEISEVLKLVNESPNDETDVLLFHFRSMVIFLGILYWVNLSETEELSGLEENPSDE